MTIEATQMADPEVHSLVEDFPSIYSMVKAQLDNGCDHCLATEDHCPICMMEGFCRTHKVEHMTVSHPDEPLTQAVQDTMGCDQCLVSEHQCPVCHIVGYCRAHTVRHMTHRHPNDPRTRAIEDVFVRSAMRNSFLTNFLREHSAVTLKRIIPNHMQSLWFQESRYLGLENPCILTWSPPKVKRGDDRVLHDTLIAHDVEWFMDIMNLQGYVWTGQENFSFFAANRTGMQYLPTDITVPDQPSISGLVMKPGSDNGRFPKRLKVYSQAPGSFFIPSPSYFPELRIPGGTQRLQIQDTGKAGDGTGMWKKSAAINFLEATRTPTWGDIIGIQTVVLAADYSFKGLFPIVPDEKFPQPDVDLVIDAESVNHQVHSENHTKGKVIPIRHRPNKRHFWAEPLVLGEVINRFIDADELASQADLIARDLDSKAWKRAHSEDQTQQLLQELQDSQKADEAMPAESHLQRATQKDGDNRLLLAYTSSAQSPFASPAVMDLVAGATASKWRSSVKKSSPMPGVMVSGEKVWLMHPHYVRVTAPKPGYLRLIWHFDNPDEFTGVGLNKKDLDKNRDALDTVDCDDRLQVIFLQDDKGKPYALVLRSPLSIDGGVCLKLTSEDARKVRALGYHFYRKVGEHKFPGLHEIGEDGNPLVPNALNPSPFEQAPEWTTDESLAMIRMLELTQYRGIMGHACNLSANLDYAGIYDPAKHKFNMSDSVIDPSLNAASDPTPVIRPMEESILEAIQNGIPMDPCVYKRVKGSVEQLHQDRQKGDKNEPLYTKLECRHHHQILKDSMKANVSFLTEQLTRRQFVANGPVPALTRTFRLKLANILTEAFDQRHNAWSAWSTKSTTLRKNKDMEKDTREVQEALLLEEVKETERTIMTKAYEKALKVTDYQIGDFMALWTQIAVGNTKRFGKTIKPMNIKSLNYLPTEEFEAHYGTGGLSLPTVVARTSERWEFNPSDDEYRVSETVVSKTKSTYQLVDHNGDAVTDLEKEARYYLGLNLVPTGYMPKIRTTKKKEIWEQAQNLLILRVTNPQVLVGPPEESLEGTPEAETQGD